MGIKLANNAFGTLAAGIASGATSITLTTGHGDRFPSLSAGDYFYATLIDTSNNLEIVKCTARATDVLTVTRAQEGTTARAYSAGDRIEVRLTAQTFSDVVDVTALAKKDGSNATGTWPVSVSGNAATATNAEKLGGESYTAYVRSVNGTTPGANGDVAVVPPRGAAIYTSSGTFTVPTGVTSVKVRGCGGGSGGGSSPGAGGTTSFGSHCSATGGIGATPGTGTGGDINLDGGKGGTTGAVSGTAAAGGAVGGGCGGGGLSTNYVAAPTGLLGGSGYYAGWTATGYGNGGGAYTSGTTVRPAGSAGGYFEKYITDLTPGSSITVTIGAAGTAGVSGVAGAPGICIVEW